MKNKLPCELIRDLFPSYIDGLTSDVTNELVEEHIAGCENCRDVLEAMQEPSEEPIDSHDSEEIDFLKRTRKRTRRIIFGSMAASLLVVAVLLIAKLFFIGSSIYSESVTCKVDVDGSHLSLNGVIADESLGISSVQFEEEDGIVTVSFKAVKRSPFHKGEFQSEYNADEEITQVRLDERIIWNQGERISALASAVYNTRHPYVGEMPANGRTAVALNMAEHLGNFTHELQTAEEPYGWKMILEDDIPASAQKLTEKDMKAYACILLAVIDNLGEISYEYTVDGKNCSLSVSADKASDFAGQDIKKYGQNVSMLQELIEKTGLDIYAYVGEDSSNQ